MSPVRLPAPLSLLASLLVIGVGLSGCASFNSVSSEVSTYGEWPAERPAGRYVIERLPSQQAQPKDQDDLEQSAMKALAGAGFAPAPDKASADVIVQIGGRVTRFQAAAWDDPLWWPAYGPFAPRWYGGGFWGRPYSPIWGPMGPRSERPEFMREVGVLIRDRATGTPLYEARARNDGITNGGYPVLGAMFAAALKDFPRVKNEPHDVQITLP